MERGRATSRTWDGHERILERNKQLLVSRSISHPQGFRSVVKHVHKISYKIYCDWWVACRKPGTGKSCARIAKRQHQPSVFKTDGQIRLVRQLQLAWNDFWFPLPVRHAKTCHECDQFHLAGFLAPISSKLRRASIFESTVPYMTYAWGVCPFMSGSREGA